MTHRILICAALGRTIFAADLMPLPAKMIPAEGKLRIDSTFGIAITGYSDARLKSAALGFVRQISKQTGVPIYTGNSAKTLVIVCREGGSPYPELGEDEAYILDVTGEGA